MTELSRIRDYFRLAEKVKDPITLDETEMLAKMIQLEVLSKNIELLIKNQDRHLDEICGALARINETIERK